MMQKSTRGFHMHGDFFSPKVSVNAFVANTTVCGFAKKYWEYSGLVMHVGMCGLGFH